MEWIQKLCEMHSRFKRRCTRDNIKSVARKIWDTDTHDQKLGNVSTDNVDNAGELRPVQPFRLLDLPDELWVRICKLAVTEENTIMMYGCCCHSANSYVEQPAITRTCRLLRTEVLPVFYGVNRFGAPIYFDSEVDNISSWLIAIGAENVHHMRILRVFGVQSQMEKCVSSLDVSGIRASLDVRPSLNTKRVTCDMCMKLRNRIIRAFQHTGTLSFELATEDDGERD